MGHRLELYVPDMQTADAIIRISVFAHAASFSELSKSIRGCISVFPYLHRHIHIFSGKFWRGGAHNWKGGKVRVFKLEYSSVTRFLVSLTRILMIICCMCSFS